MTSEQMQDGSGCKHVDSGIHRVFHLLGKRWTGPIVAVLLEGPLHFADLGRAVPGISERMLSDRLTDLGAAGLVVREVEAGPPLRVSYQLTRAGAALEPAIRELRTWAEDHLPESTAACQSLVAAAAGEGSRIVHEASVAGT
ncbi:helix-turn-helix domain-containing protein [Streptomyces sp. T12]|uniref:winged helix-turn-helix transcriptional regulator n=1 Tax=Streptomyces sp. T12 TaxID=477697 RepID=UPI0011A5276B|nr:helix-turn-helix domain-containing protein [Streptomyces sp. T12]